MAIAGLGLVESALVFGSIALQVALRAHRDGLLYSAMGYAVPVRVLYMIQLRQIALNYLPMKAGTIYSAAVLKARYGVAYSHFAAAFAAQNVFTTGVVLVAAAFVPLFAWGTAGAHNWTAAGVMAGLGLGSFGLLFLKIPGSARLPARLNRIASMVHAGMGALRRRPPVWLGATALSLAAVTLLAYRLQVLFHVAGEPISLGVGLVFAAGVLISILVAVTPAGIGIRELIIGSTSGLVMASPAIGVIVSAMERVLVLIYAGAVVLAVAAIVGWMTGRAR